MLRMHGFTVIDAVTALAVGAIATGLAVPTVANYVNSSRVTSTSNTFVSTMQLARSEAITRGTTVTISATDPQSGTNEWGGGALVWIDADDNGVFDMFIDTPLLDQDGSVDSITIDSATGVLAVEFDSLGRANPAGSFLVCAGETDPGREIQLNDNGRVVVREVTCESSEGTVSTFATK